MSKTKTAFAVINPATGQESVRRLEGLLRKTASRRGVELDIRVTERPEHATEMARECCERGIEIVVAVGGDGTVSEVVTGTIGSNLIVGIVPIGSTNMIAKDVGIPRRLQSAMDVALGGGVPTTFDVGRVGETTFMHMAGAGYDAEIMREASGVWKRRIGWPAYLWPAIKHLRSDPFRVEIEIDDDIHTWRARMVLCAIGGSIVHPRFTVGAGIDRTDGQIDVCVYDPPNAIGAVSALGWILLRNPQRSRWQHQLRGKKVFLRSDRPIAFEADGNPLGELPVVVEMLDEGVQILIPQGA
jgi:diacylglycerol kinase (ATP)